MLQTGTINKLHDLLETRTATVGVVGLGYVGLPLAATAAKAGFQVIGFDVDPAKVLKIGRGQSYIDAVGSDLLHHLQSTGKLSATVDFSRFAECDVICICVPTPLTRQREPDLSFVVQTAGQIGKHIRAQQLVILESTTYPGTTDEIVKPILERGGLRSGSDFFLGYSPEREDPGNQSFNTATIPKVVAGDGPVAQRLITLFYGSFVHTIVPVSSIKVAEVVKVTENVFRAVNIALVNELKVIYTAMGIDVWEVIDAAKTKPFGFMPFYPGPGLGGHCIPIDPFYLTWKSREFDLSTRFIELAGEINVNMPHYVFGRLAEALDMRLGLPLSQASVLLIGISYKKNVSDTRESPALKLIELLAGRAADVAFHDPHFGNIPKTRRHPALTGRRSVRLTQDSVAAYDAVVIVTDHDIIDYELIAKHSRLVVDTRNALGSRGIACDHVVKA